MYKFFLEIDWKAFLLGNESWSFLLEAIIRTFIMFAVILLSLRLLGKRGVKQLSVFELGVIIGLGSAAGDPMFYKDVGLLSGIVVFLVVIGLYRLITFIINRSDRFEEFVEGKPVSMIKEGKFLVSNFEKEPIAHDEFFSQLRMHSVSHLGQVQQAIIETNGELSLYFFPDDEVDYGLPIIPDLCENKLEAITEEGYYACTFCATTKKLLPARVHHCPVCKKKEWLKAINNKRVK